MNVQDKPELHIPMVIESDLLVAWFHEGQGERLVVSFSDVGPGDGVIPPMAFARLATNDGAGHALFLSDPARSWMNADGLAERCAEVIEDYAAKVGAKEIVTIGNSMGGYAAALIANFTKVDRAICFSPQSTVHPDIAGDDLRWPSARAAIKAHRFDGLEGHMAERTQYFALFGDNPREATQYARFPKGENCHVLMVPKQGHGLALFLKRKGLMKKLVKLSLDGKFGRVAMKLNKKFDAYWRREDQTGMAPVKMKPDALTKAAALGQDDTD